jgi:hypothetical protein
MWTEQVSWQLIILFISSLLLNFTTGSCKFINCLNGKQCIEDQNFLPQCVNCPKCSQKNRTLDLKKLVCGVDGITYRSMCELRQKSCKIGKSIQPAYRGPCTGKDEIFFILLHFYVFSNYFRQSRRRQEEESFNINFNW